MRYLIIGSCTSKKDYPKGLKVPENYDDFNNPELMASLEEYKKKAKDLYTGEVHKKLTNAISMLRDKDVDVSYMILSAGYGLLKETDEIVPYNISFQKMEKDEIIASSNKLNIPQSINEVVIGYDVIIFSMGKEYLRAVQFELIENLKDKIIIIIDSPSSCRNWNLECKKSYRWLVGNPREFSNNYSFRSDFIQSVANHINNAEDFDSYAKNIIADDTDPTHWEIFD